MHVFIGRQILFSTCDLVSRGELFSTCDFCGHWFLGESTNRVYFSPITFPVDIIVRQHSQVNKYSRAPIIIIFVDYPHHQNR